MIELPLIFVAGLLGSSHCVGMCGPLALALGANQQRARTNVGRQVVFTLGRIFTYSFLGVVASFTGWWLLRQPLAFINVQSVLSIVAGVVLVILGLSYAGVLRLPYAWLAPVTSCSSARWLKTLIVGPGYTTALLAGVFTGFIPCGLVYAMLGIAATTGNLVQGWLTMVAFGLGTAPLMILAGTGGTLLSHATRGRILRLAALCVLTAGLITIARGAGLIHHPSPAFGDLPLHNATSTNPFCW